MLGLFANCSERSCPADKGERRIDPSLSDERIIRQVESLTPIGSTAAEIVAIIHSDFRDDGMVSGIGLGEQWSWNHGTSIELPIGYRMKMPPSVEMIDAIWEFDAYRILRRIKIKRFITKGSSLQSLRRPAVIFIDPLWPDAKIRRTLLCHSPVGTAWQKVPGPEHFHFAGCGDPFPWIGEHGLALVLAILPKGGGSYTDVRVIWVRSKDDKLKDIIVQRADYTPRSA